MVFKVVMSEIVSALVECDDEEELRYWVNTHDSTCLCDIANKQGKDYDFSFKDDVEQVVPYEKEKKFIITLKEEK